MALGAVEVGETPIAVAVVAGVACSACGAGLGPSALSMVGDAERVCKGTGVGTRKAQAANNIKAVIASPIRSTRERALAETKIP